MTAEPYLCQSAQVGLWSARRLKVELRSQLHVARIARPGYLSCIPRGTTGPRGRRQSWTRSANTCISTARTEDELSVIERVERFQPQLETLAFSEIEILEN